MRGARGGGRAGRRGGGLHAVESHEPSLVLAFALLPPAWHPGRVKTYSAYIAMDKELHAYANLRLDQDLTRNARCAAANTQLQHDAVELKRFQLLAQPSTP